ILTLPLPELAGSGVAAALAADEGRRRFPIDVAKVFGPRTVTYELRLTLPEGWRAELPPPVTAVSAFGTYDARYSQAGRAWRAKRMLRFRRSDSSHVERYSASRQPVASKNRVPSAGANWNGAFPAATACPHVFSIILSSAGDARSISHHRNDGCPCSSVASP